MLIRRCRSSRREEALLSPTRMSLLTSAATRFWHRALVPHFLCLLLFRVFSYFQVADVSLQLGAWVERQLARRGSEKWRILSCIPFRPSGRFSCFWPPL